jgi:hypothetical protein
MSRIASPGASHPMLIPGGMMESPMSRAPSRKLTATAGNIMPAAKASKVTPVTAASCGPVMSETHVVRVVLPLFGM